MLRGSLAILHLKVLGEGLGLLALVVAARQLSLEAAGLLIYLLNGLVLFGSLAALGLDTTLLRFVPRYMASGDLPAVRALSRWVLTLATCASAAAGLAFLAVQQGSPVLELSALQQAAVLACITGWSLVTLARYLMRAMGLTWRSDLSYQLLRPGGMLLVLLICPPLIGEGASVYAALLAPLLLALALDTRRILALLGGQIGGPSCGDRGAWRTATRHFTSIMVSRVLLQRLDILVVGALLGLEAAAIYGVAARLSLLVAVAVEPVQGMFQPRASRHFGREDRAALRRDVTRGALWTVAAALVAAAVLLLAPAFWLGLFGDLFDPSLSVSLLAIMIAGRFLAALSSTAQSLALMGGHERQQARVQFAVAVLAYPPLLLCATLAGGLAGAALATLLSRGVLALLKVHLAWRNTGLSGLASPNRQNLRLAFGPVLDRLRDIRHARLQRRG